MPSWWYFYDESFYWRTETEYALQLGRPDAALQAVDRSLALIDPANLHNYSFRLLFRAEAFIKQGEIAEATNIIGDVAGLTAVSRSGRLDQRLDGLRATLTRWDKTKAVRRLDERLAVYRGSLDAGNGNTKRTYSR